MMTGTLVDAPPVRPGGPAFWLERLLVVAGVGGLAAITWIYPATTRMYATPWENILNLTLLIPPLLLLVPTRRPARDLIPRDWGGLAIAIALLILISALASPFRATALRNSAVPWSGIALFLAVLSWLQKMPGSAPQAIAGVQKRAGAFFAGLVFISLVQWLRTVPGHTFAALANGRNPYPLGHSNYTAGMTLLFLPTFVALARYTQGWVRIVWSGLALLTVGLLFTTSSRGGWLGLGVFAVVSFPLYLRLSRRATAAALLVIVLFLGAGLWLNPRTRGTFSGNALHASDVQRSAMAHGGWLIGKARPWLGWGAGTVPVAFPLYRQYLAGGVEDVLELHSTPAQIWAEFGCAGILFAGLILALALRAARRTPIMGTLLYPFSGYAVFSLTDWQADIPLFAAICALGAAGLAAAGESLLAPTPVLRVPRWALGLGFVALVGSARWAVPPDPTPGWNVRALALGQEPAGAAAAKALLQRSLADSPAQEIAHFNLAWLEVVDNPRDAEAHFRAAAQLVPDKGGVYFGLGLALLNQGRSAEAVDAWAIEAVNDPAFLASPWRRLPRIQNLDTAFAAALGAKIARAEALVPAGSAEAATLRYLRELAAWVANGTPVTEATSAAQKEFFAGHPTPEPLTQASIIAYHRERTGYPVLMRDLNLRPPLDIFLVQENALAARNWKFLFPAKGWLDNRIVLRLLSEPIAPIN